jgi:D-3-phosphoglycerate dehydrogenase
MKVLITDALADAGMQVLRQEGVEVDYRPGLEPDALLRAVAGAEGLIVRSGTQVTRAVIERAERLRIVGRAGAGVDNVDLEAANEKGVAVVNAPFGNTVSACEQAMALMMALARHLPQANASLRAGKWERSRFQGVELAEKTLGILGFGRVGRCVAVRARAFEMSIMAHDPLIAPAVFQREGLEPSGLDEVLAAADFLTLHLPRTAETRNLLNAERLSRCKKGIRIVNAARGGVIDEAALLAALESGQVAGAALDVFAEEPPGDSPLLRHERVVATPHLGASTAEAQLRVARDVAADVARYLATGDAENLVNREALARRK